MYQDGTTISSRIQTMPRVFATADIGSNTVHLLVANHGPEGIQKVLNESEWLSLGQVVSHYGEIPSEVENKLLSTLAKFKKMSASQNAEGLYVFATEAMRKARNHREVLKSIRKELSITVDLITPQREAELGLKGALLDVPIAGQFIFAETGGGSVQIAECFDLEIKKEISLSMGTGVILDQAKLKFPCSEMQVTSAIAVIQESISRLDGFTACLPIIACGGVARGLWRALHPDGDPVIRKGELDYLFESVQLLNIATICRRFDVKAKRASTLFPGALVYKTLMERFNTSQMTVSQFGVREGAVLELSQGKILPNKP